MTVLIVGYGSIGQRHHRNCVAMGHDVEIFSAHQKKTKLSKDQYDLIVVASKTSDRFKDVLRFKNFSKNFFIEKPLAINSEEGKKVQKILRGKKVMVGYCLIFDPVIMAAKKILDKKKVGKIFLAQIHCGSYLPEWRKGDYRKNYSAHKKMGGGVLLDLIHETNYAQYLFPEPINKISGYANRISNLEITSDDTALIVLKQKDRFVHISLNYWQRLFERYIRIHGEEGTLLVDLENFEIQLFNKKNKKILDKKFKVDSNKMYLEELSLMEQYIKGQKALPEFFSINQAIKDLKIVDYVR